MAADIKCPEGHTRVWAKGLVPSRSGPKQRYICFTCGRTFYKSKPGGGGGKKSKSGKKKS